MAKKRTHPLPQQGEGAEIIVAEGKSYQRTIVLPPAKGKAGRKMTARLMPFIAPLEKIFDTSGARPSNPDELDISIGEIFEIINDIWGNDDTFEDEILPMSLNLDMTKKENRDWLEELTLMEVVIAFVNAASHWIFGGIEPGTAEDMAELEKK